MNYIASYCFIKNNQCFINGKEVCFEKESTDNLKSIYKLLTVEYPKFYKMDKLSKVGFLGVELLKKEMPEIELFGENEVAILFSNKNSSALTDLDFQESYNNGGTPSPALFVYTLPNILIGEIAIRNKWYGENMFAITSNFNPIFFVNNCNIMFNKGSNAAICGWVNVTEDEVDAFLFFVTNVTKKDIKQLNLQLNPTQLLKLYKTIK